MSNHIVLQMQIQMPYTLLIFDLDALDGRIFA
jgi:hypothetical protein